MRRSASRRLRGATFRDFVDDDTSKLEERSLERRTPAPLGAEASASISASLVGGGGCDDESSVVRASVENKCDDDDDGDGDSDSDAGTFARAPVKCNELSNNLHRNTRTARDEATDWSAII
jgi:hypothetical protein